MTDPSYEQIARAKRREAAYEAIIVAPRARLYRARLRGDPDELALAEKAYWAAYKRAVAAYKEAA